MAHMQENIFMGTFIFNKSKTLVFVKESNHPCCDQIIFFNRLLFWSTYLYILLLKHLLFMCIRRRRRNISVFINVGHHLFQCFSFFSICFSFRHLFGLVLLLL